MSFDFDFAHLEPSLVEGMARNIFNLELCVGTSDIEGNFDQMNKEYNMIFVYFIMKRGRILAKGKDRFYGEFDLIGSYDNEGNIKFVKRINGQNIEFLFVGNLKKLNEEKDFDIRGEWRDSDGDSDSFQIKGKIK